MSQLQISDVWQPDPTKHSRFARFKGVVHLSIKQLKYRFLESLLILLGIALGVGVVTGTETFLRYINTLQQSYLAENITTVSVRPQMVNLSDLYSSGGVPAIRIAAPLTDPVELTVEHMLRAKQDVPTVAFADTFANESLGGEILAIDGEPLVAHSEDSILPHEDGFGGEGGFASGDGVVIMGSSPTELISDMPPYLMFNGTTPDGIALKKRTMLAGRWMTWDEYNEGRPVLILEEADVPKVFPDIEPEEVIGRTLTVTTYSSDGPVDINWQIIGVVQQRDMPGLSSDFMGRWVEGYGPHTVNNDGPIRVMEMNFAPADPNGIEELIADLEIYFASIFGEGRVEVTNPMDMLAELQQTSRSMSIALLGLSGLTLFVAAINILNLFTARVIRRRRASAMTVALGAERRSLFYRIVTEAMLLGVAGSVIGLGVARGVVSLLENRYGEISLSLADVGFGLLVGVFFSVLFGMYPAYLSSSMDPADGLRTE